MSAHESQPLLYTRSSNSNIVDHILWQRWLPGGSTYVTSTRAQVQRFLTSKTGHYAVLLLVALDVSSIFADFLISLFICEQSCKTGQKASKGLIDAQDILGIVSLVFSCLFMAELLASLWAFGIRYFKSWFHCFDATVIIAGFVIDVCLKGVLEEAGSIIVVLRLWRVFKIIEEFSAGAEDQISELTERIEQLEKEKDQMSLQLKNRDNETGHS
ncbi:MAG: hypothetical protein Q9195_000540 [Heterodermia aff. obscurata]